MDLDRLVAKNPHLKPYYRDGSYDFSSTEAQCLVAEAYLNTYCGLKVNLDRRKLCPRIPNRLSYLNWCEEAAGVISEFETAQLAIDIGTGSSAIYPLLGVSRHPELHFIGTEIDPESIAWARKIVTENNLEDKICILDSAASSHRPTFPRVDENIRYTMCNPPFYTNGDDLYERSKFKNLKPNELLSSDSEMFYEGGEVQFIKDLLHDSIELAKEKPETVKTCWFLSQIGIKSNCFEVESVLNEAKAARKITQFRIDKLQTHGSSTSRWVVAWATHWWRWPTGKAIYTVNLDVKKVHHEIFQKLEKELAAIEEYYPQLECNLQLSSGNIIVRTNVPFWTRKYRRAFLRRARILPIMSNIYRIETCRIRWVHGCDYQIFYSFCKFIFGIVEQSGRHAQPWPNVAQSGKLQDFVYRSETLFSGPED